MARLLKGLLVAGLASEAFSLKPSLRVSSRKQVPKTSSSEIPSNLDSLRSFADDASTEDMRAELQAQAERLALDSSFANPLSLRLQDPFVAPFYVYDDVDWMSMKCQDKVTHEPERWGEILHKHSDDFWFLKAALRHPKRTKDPSQAELFVVPGAMNLLIDGMAWIKSNLTCCIDNICDEELIKATDAMLANSPWFQRKEGKDHVVVCSHYACLRYAETYSHIQMCNTISFEENSRRGDRCRIASTYVGKGCPHKDKNAMFAMIGHFMISPERGAIRHTFEPRWNICQWLGNASITAPHGTDSFITASVCGPGDQCPALAKARFGFHVRGDTLGSSRLIDTILSGTVPLFTHEKQYDILPPFVPWRDVSFLVNISTNESFLTSIESIASADYEAMAAKLDTVVPLIDWKTSVPFEHYMALFQNC